MKYRMDYNPIWVSKQQPSATPMHIVTQNLIRVLSQGFNNKKVGHGFDSHSGALAASEMSGSLTVYSAVPGQGATFTLELRCPTRENFHE